MVQFSRPAAILLVALFAIDNASAFSVVPQQHGSSSSKAVSSTQLNGLFDGMKGAFANDDSLGKAKDAGLSKGPNYNENVTVNGKPVQGAVVGQKLTVVAGRARVKIPVNCQQG